MQMFTAALHVLLLRHCKDSDVSAVSADESALCVWCYAEKHVLISLAESGYNPSVFQNSGSAVWLHWGLWRHFLHLNRSVNAVSALHCRNKRVLNSNSSICASWCFRPYLIAALSFLLLLNGCAGRSIKVDNPVFAQAPPRKALVNSASDPAESMMADACQQSGVVPVGFNKTPGAPLEGTSVVAFVNGRPVFLDDVLGGFRQMLESKSEISPDQRDYVMRERLRKQLPAHIDQEIVLQALNQKVPEDRRKMIRESLEPMFEQVTANIKQDRNLQTDQQLNDLLANEGMSIDTLRESFVRIQMVNGYVATLANAPQNVDRQELLDYYHANIADYTTEEKVRFAEIVVRFDQHGGREGAEAVMANVVRQLRSGREFGEVAEAFSDALSSEKKGDMGWIERNSLADQELETSLFDLPEGKMTKVIVKPDRFELYEVISHKQQSTVSFQDVQKEIEKLLLKKKADQAKEKVTDDLRARAIIETIFDAV